MTEPLIRHLASEEDYQACLALQYETWGNAFREAVPPTILLVSQRLGGIAAGAFDSRGTLLGFVFGMTGVRNGAITHWSDMLAVRPDAQNSGIGRALKEFQRREVAKVGARTILWTFDPLIARNAHLNFNVYGARAIEYVPNMYGTNTGSDLHRGIGTDRFVMEWPVDDGDLARQRARAAAAHVNETFQNAPELGDPARPAGAGAIPDDLKHLRIAVPDSFADIVRSDSARAEEWRRRTRAAFQSAMGTGFRVEGFARGRDGRGGAYLLAR